LWQAVAMMGTRMSQVRIGPPDPVGAGVDRVVLVVTDSDPHDMLDAKDAARALREQGVRLIFVRLLRLGQQSESANLHTLAALGDHAPSLDTAAYPDGVFEVEDDSEALHGAAPLILQQLLRVTQRISRAHCTIPWTSSEDVGVDIERVAGLDLCLSEDMATVSPSIQEVAPLAPHTRAATPSAPNTQEATGWFALSEHEAAKMASRKPAEVLQKDMQNQLHAWQEKLQSLKAEWVEDRETTTARIRNFREAERAAMQREQVARVGLKMQSREADLKIAAASHRAEEAEARLQTAREKIRASEERAKEAERERLAYLAEADAKRDALGSAAAVMPISFLPAGADAAKGQAIGETTSIFSPSPKGADISFGDMSVIEPQAEVAPQPALGLPTAPRIESQGKDGFDPLGESRKSTTAGGAGDSAGKFLDNLAADDGEDDANLTLAMDSTPEESDQAPPAHGHPDGEALDDEGPASRGHPDGEALDSEGPASQGHPDGEALNSEGPASQGHPDGEALNSEGPASQGHPDGEALDGAGPA